MRPVLALAILLAAGLTACGPPAAPPEANAASVSSLSEVPGGSFDAVAPLQAAVVAMREEVQLRTLAVVPAPPKHETDQAFTSCAVHLITRWEVSGVQAYTRKWQGVIWPGGSSGPTWGIGYDGGHQTRFDIARDWSEHPGVTGLLTTSGVIGITAKQRLSEWGGIRTPYPYAAQVFVQASLPAYTHTAERAFGPGFVLLPPGARCGLVSMVYNRGGQTVGPRRLEYRVIRDVCIPAQDLSCIATQIRASKRLWPDVRGIRDRRDDEARTVLVHEWLAANPAPQPVHVIHRLTPPSRPSRQRWSLASNWSSP